MPEQNNILFLASIPKNKLPLRILAEFTIMQMVLEQGVARDFYNVFSNFSVSSFEILKYVYRVKPHIVHFSLHGNKSKGLFLTDDENNNESILTLKDFELIFSNITKKINISGVILSACNSYLFGKAIIGYVDYVIAMDDFIDDQAAVAFTRYFYATLFDDNNYDIEQVFNLAVTAVDLKKFKDAEDNDIEYNKIIKLITK